MTEQQKPKRNETTLTKGVVVDRIAEIHSSAEDRENAALAEIRNADIAKMHALLKRVPVADQGAVAKMLAALGIEIPVMDAAFEDPAVNLGEETAPESLPVGAREYVPGPAAQAARGARR